MVRLLVLKLEGTLETGFAATLESKQTGIGSATPTRIKGQLFGNEEVLNNYRQWQQRYSSLEHLFRQLKHSNPDQVTNTSQRLDAFDACQNAADVLVENLNDWLNNDRGFQPIRDRAIASGKKFRFLLQTNCVWLQRLPWHKWTVLANAEAEIAFSIPEYDSADRPEIYTPKNRVKILAILGYAADIDRHADKRVLEEIAGKAGASITWKEEPSREELTTELRKGCWDLLFFVGHSASTPDGKRCQFQLTRDIQLEISDIKYALRQAKGLRLAMFNSCDGLGLAHQLAAEKGLALPHLIVMREKIPDPVSPKFLEYFLEAFTGGRSLSASVGLARERLHDSWENKYPCASWLPVVFPNPAEDPPTWQELRYGKEPQRSKRILKRTVLANVGITALVMGMRFFGLLQTWELQAYDQLMRWRPDEGVDNRLLVVEVTEEDLNYQREKGIIGQWSLSDAALEQVLEKLTPHQPRAIGLDIYRDFPVHPDYQGLVNRLQNNDRFFAICEGNNPTKNFSGVSPPPEVPENRVGFSDVVRDSDGVLRRYLWYATFHFHSLCTAQASFSLLLALRYLADEGIEPEVIGENLQVGGVRLRRLERPAGGYQQFESEGYQMLLNYRTRGDVAPRITLTEVLEGGFDPSWVEDRVVLIGVTAPSINDNFATPFSSDPDRSMRGVFVQVQMVSQILSAVLDGRSLLWVLPGWGDVLWVGGWGLVGGLLAWRYWKVVSLAMVGGVVVGVLYAVCFMGFIQGVWLPLVPSMLALAGTGGSAIWLRHASRPLSDGI